MAHALKWSISAAVAFAAGLIASVATADPKIGAVTQADYNGATGKRVLAAASSENLIFDHAIFEQEVVSTPKGSSTVIKFKDDTQIQIGENSSVTLDKFVYDDTAKATDATINFTKGFFRYVGGSATERNVVLKTPTTALAVRGTAVNYYVGSDGSTVIGMESGSGSLQTCAGAAPITINAGQAYRVSASCKGGDSIAMTDVPIPAAVSAPAPSPGNGPVGPAISRGAIASGNTGSGGNVASNVDSDHDGDPGDPHEGRE